MTTRPAAVQPRLPLTPHLCDCGAKLSVVNVDGVCDGCHDFPLGEYKAFVCCVCGVNAVQSYKGKCWVCRQGGDRTMINARKRQQQRKGWVRANVEYLVMASNGPMLTGHTAPGLCENGVLYVRNDSNEKFHQTGKPVEVAERIIKMRADIKTVVDPFMGSGTTGLACLKLGINFIGIEKSPEYFAIAQRRIAAAQAQLVLPLFTPTGAAL